MLIIGCDYHPSMQQIAWVDKETGECGERRLLHRSEAEEFYRQIKEKQVRVGIEATGHSRWFERMVAELLRFLLGQSAQSAARCEEQWHRQYAHLRYAAQQTYRQSGSGKKTSRAA